MSDGSRFDVLVIGAGPAGVAAAIAAAESGARVGVVDDNPAPGGQIWRRGAGDDAARTKARPWIDKLERSGAEVLSGARVVDHPQAHQVLTQSALGARVVAYDKLVIAAGARELFLPFPGWTLPNVCGAGGLQALVRSGLPIEGKRVVVAGTGPLLWAVAAGLAQSGAVVRLLAEQAPRGQVVRFGLGLWRSPGKLIEAVRLRRELAGVPTRFGCWPVLAHGDDRLESVTLTRGGETWNEPCDYLACGYGLIPNAEIALLLGCEMDRGSVLVDRWQETSRGGLFCAGEMAGIGGVDLAIEEGLVAGYAAAGQRDRARSRFKRREKARLFARALGRSFVLRAEVKALAAPDTIVCRCEDVTHQALAPFASWREAKLQTRCGMGPCQGRVCGAATRVVFGWGPTTVRSPIFPASLGALATGAGPQPASEQTGR